MTAFLAAFPWFVRFHLRLPASAGFPRAGATSGGAGNSPARRGFVGVVMLDLRSVCRAVSRKRRAIRLPPVLFSPCARADYPPSLRRQCSAQVQPAYRRSSRAPNAAVLAAKSDGRQSALRAPASRSPYQRQRRYRPSRSTARRYAACLRAIGGRRSDAGSGAASAAGPRRVPLGSTGFGRDRSSPPPDSASRSAANAFAVIARIGTEAYCGGWRIRRVASKPVQTRHLDIHQDQVVSPLRGAPTPRRHRPRCRPTVRPRSADPLPLPD